MTDAGESTTFNKAGIVAAPERAAQLRREFSAWLGTHFTLDAVKASDIVLAVNEALANAAEFAYSNAKEPGVMHVRADYDTEAETLTVVVADEGAWRIGDTDHKNPARGRGIPLMHALTDRAVIDATASGTEVRLQWHNVSRSVPSELR
ncbi:ATP-binding protein [Mycolicibacterium goodii]|uniref:Anti-sigma regulatory factor n=1 Tax=Mycolicibacterium goodii TaxID=134601 RepID=A0A0K0X3X3_MYCGD|nr:anti-sigma regulatory factor [Mycolicibacterium goodii]